MSKHRQQILTSLKQAGYKLTKPRRAVIDILTKKQHPLTAADIHRYLPSIDLASIYRALDVLTKLNIAQVEQVNNSSYYYLDSTLHHHIICEQCGYKQCLPCKHTFNINNFVNIKHQLTLTGICQSCAIKLNQQQ